MVLFSRSNIVRNDWKYVEESLDTASISLLGSYVLDFENNVSNYVGSKYTTAKSVGTSYQWN